MQHMQGRGGAVRQNCGERAEQPRLFRSLLNAFRTLPHLQQTVRVPLCVVCIIYRRGEIWWV